MSDKIISDVNTFEPGDLVELFELDLSTGIADAGASEPVLRWHAGLDQNLRKIIWQGNSYSPFPIQADGFEFSGKGTIPRPSLTVANVTSVMSSLMGTYQDLAGAKVTRKRTFAKYLDSYCYIDGHSQGGICTGESGDDPSLSESDCINAVKNGSVGIWNTYNELSCMPEKTAELDIQLVDNGNFSDYSTDVEDVTFTGWGHQETSGVDILSATVEGAKLLTTTVGDQTWHHRFYQYLGTKLVLGEEYTLKFSVKASSSIRARIQEGDSTSPQTTTPTGVNSTTWVHHEETFTCTASTGSTRLDLWVRPNTAGDWIEVANVSLTRAPLLIGSEGVSMKINSSTGTNYNAGEVFLSCNTFEHPSLGNITINTNAAINSEYGDTYVGAESYGTYYIMYSVVARDTRFSPASGFDNPGGHTNFMNVVPNGDGTWNVFGNNEPNNTTYSVDFTPISTDVLVAAITADTQYGGLTSAIPLSRNGIWYESALADSLAHFSDEIWYIDRKALETRTHVQFELAAAHDVQGINLPGRTIVANMCPWVYRGSECSYTGTDYWGIDGTEAADLESDKCGKRFFDCELRFPYVVGFCSNATYTTKSDCEDNSAEWTPPTTSPFGGFPGAGINMDQA